MFLGLGIFWAVFFLGIFHGEQMVQFFVFWGLSVTLWIEIIGGCIVRGGIFTVTRGKKLIPGRSRS